MKKYNIIYLHTHDTGRYIDPYGYAIGTPNLMEFAKQSIVFRDCHAAAPTCSPSRACLLTGTYAHNNGQLGLVNRGINLLKTNWHMASFFKSLEYDTVLSGVQHVHSDAHLLGYKKVISTQRGSDTFDKVDERNTQNAIDLIKNASSPYFLSVGLFETYREFYPQGVDDNFVVPPYPIVDNIENRKDFARYISTARHMDENAGKLLRAVKSAGQWDNTIIFFTTDHGIAMPRMKCNLYSSGTGVSLMFRYPGMKHVGKSIDSLCSHIDIFPTICDILGIDAPEWLQGVSQLPVMQNLTDSVRDEIFAEINHHTQTESMRCVRTKEWLYIKSLHQRRSPTNCDASSAKNYFLSTNYFEKQRPLFELYDLIEDPCEYNNLAKDPQYKDILSIMDKKLNNWMENTDDPFLSGKIELPFTTISNSEGEIDPEGKVYCEGNPSINGTDQMDVVRKSLVAYARLTP